ncbi:MAG: cytochrome c [Thiotrichaceae bacterium]|nr:cytochrome c [Thiotrichaceae bacterium]
MLRKLFYLVLFSSAPCFAETQLLTPNPVLYNNAVALEINLHLTTPLTGDLYLATQLPSDPQLLFITPTMGLQSSPTPYLAKQTFTGDSTLLSIASDGMPIGVYPVYQIITQVGASPFDSSAWLTALNMLQFSVGLPPHISGDYNSDGLADGDCNGNGIADDAVGCEQKFLSANALSNTLTAGKNLYQKNCQGCHGQDFKPAQFVEIIKNSLNIVPNKKTILGRLTETEFDQIASYMANLQSKMCR